MKKHRAAVFDMDGVIVDSAPLHRRAWQVVLRKHDIPFAEEKFRRFFNARDAAVAPRLIGVMSDEETACLVDEKSVVFQQLIRTEGRPVRGVIEFIEKLQKLQVLTALASLARPEEIDVVLDTVGLRDKLRIVITGEQMMRDKPAPDIFLTAAFRLALPPTEVVVFEDAVSGVEAARASGATTIALTTTYSPGELSHADLVIQDFHDPKLFEFFVS